MAANLSTLSSSIYCCLAAYTNKMNAVGKLLRIKCGKLLFDDLIVDVVCFAVCLGQAEVLV